MDFRSSDVFLGLPYDIIVGALLLTHVAEFCEIEVGCLGLSLKNCHIYNNHLEGIRKYIESEIYDLPKLMSDSKSLSEYKSGPFIKAELNN